MVAGDAHALGGRLAHGFTFTHMTGFVQSRREWLERVASGEMNYHSMEDVAVSVEGADTGAPVLTAQPQCPRCLRPAWP
jgi:hypothetical protein